MLSTSVERFVSAVHELEDLACEQVLGFPLAWVEIVCRHGGCDDVCREEGEEVEVALDVGVGGAQEELGAC